MTIWDPLSDKIEQKFKMHPNPYPLGNILVMVRTPPDAADTGVGPMSIWEPLPDKVEQKFKKVLITLTLGNILTMVMVPILVSAVLAGPDHDQNVP